jgi:molybdate transport system ATP-binding protein
MTLQVEARVAERGFDVSLDVAEGETLAVLGPNGAGKSTLLSILAGLLRPDSGRAGLTGETLFDLSRRHWLPPHQRGISLLAQEPLLFPHLSALENVAFGPRSAGRSRAEARASARRWLSAVEAADLWDSRPAQLSGGQAQRVAIARALAPEPRLLLLDEPLAALDVAVAPTLRRMLRTVLAGRTAIIVTHEVLDALTLADRVVVLGDGVIVEQGATAEVLQRPRHPFTAGLAGLNLLTGVRTATGLRMAHGGEVTGSGTGAIGVPAAAAARPSAICVQLVKTVGPNTFPVTVEDLEPRGDSVRVRSASMVADISPGRVAALGLTPGLRVWFTVPESEVTIYPR